MFFIRSGLRMSPINHEKFHGNRSARFSKNPEYRQRRQLLEEFKNLTGKHSAILSIINDAVYTTVKQVDDTHIEGSPFLPYV